MNPLGGRSTTVAWWSFGALLVAFVVTRWWSGPSTFVVAQLVFLVPVFAAALLTLEAHRVAPPGDERAVWGLLSVAAWLLVGSESYYSWYQLARDRAGPVAPSPSDWLNLAAACTFVAILAIASGLARRSLLVRLRFFVDAVAVMALGILVLFRFWSGDLVEPVGWPVAARWAVSSFLGVAILGTVVWLGFGVRRAAVEDRRRSLLVGLSVAIFATGILLAPFAQHSSQGSTTGGLTVVLQCIFLMVGYSFMAMAAFLRVQHRGEPWRAAMSRPPGGESEWTTGVLSLLVLIGVCLAGAFAYNDPSIEASTVYVILGVTATFAMVARTALLGVEGEALRASAGKDPLTGIGNQSAYEDQLAIRVMLSRRSRDPFVLVVLNLDDFGRVNEVLGRSGGDRVLVRVAEALQNALGRKCEAFRLAANEFAVIAPGFGFHDRMPVGTDLLAAVSGIELGHGLRLAASVGVISCDDDECEAAVLAQQADAAQVWAKYHGKGRVVVHDERIVRALGAEERLRLNSARLHYDVVRALVACADARDSSSIYHARNVSALAVLLGDAVGLDDEGLRSLEIAALLHDVGQIALADELVVGSLTPRRRLAAREHSILGAQLVDAVGVEGISGSVRSHHERWDGAGYPDGLSGEEIALGSRIIALADAYDGMTSGRRSGIPMSRAAALQEIDHALGTRFDPLLAEEFIRLVGTTSSLGWSDEWMVQA